MWRARVDATTSRGVVPAPAASAAAVQRLAPTFVGYSPIDTVTTAAPARSAERQAADFALAVGKRLFAGRVPGGFALVPGAEPMTHAHVLAYAHTALACTASEIPDARALHDDALAFAMAVIGDAHSARLQALREAIATGNGDAITAAGRALYAVACDETLAIAHSDCHALRTEARREGLRAIERGLQLGGAVQSRLSLDERVRLLELDGTTVDGAEALYRATHQALEHGDTRFARELYMRARAWLPGWGELAASALHRWMADEARRAGCVPAEDLAANAKAADRWFASMTRELGSSQFFAEREAEVDAAFAARAGAPWTAERVAALRYDEALFRGVFPI